MTLTLGSRSHKMLPSTLHIMTYTPAKFEVDASNSVGEDAFTRKYIIWPCHQGHTICCPIPSTSCDLCTCKVCSCYILQFRRRCIYKKIHYLTLTLGLRSYEVLPSTLYIMWPIHLQSLKVLCPRVKEEMHLQENTLFDLDLWVKVPGNVAQYPLHPATYVPVKFEVNTSNG